MTTLVAYRSPTDETNQPYMQGGDSRVEGLTVELAAATTYHFRIHAICRTVGPQPGLIGFGPGATDPVFCTYTARVQHANGAGTAAVCTRITAAGEFTLVLGVAAPVSLELTECIVEGVIETDAATELWFFAAPNQAYSPVDVFDNKVAVLAGSSIIVTSA